MIDELQMQLETLFGKPLNAEQVEAFRGAVSACGDYDMDDDDILDPASDGEGAEDLAIVFGPGKKK